MKHRRRLFAKYAFLIMGLVSAALLASGALEIYVSHRERRATLDAAQYDKAKAAAATVARYIEDLARQIEPFFSDYEDLVPTHGRLLHNFSRHGLPGPRDVTRRRIKDREPLGRKRARATARLPPGP